MEFTSASLLLLHWIHLLQFSSTFHTVMAEIQQEWILSSSRHEWWMLPSWCCIEFLGLKVTEGSLGSRTVCPPIFSLFVLQCSDIPIPCLVQPWKPPVWEHSHLFVKSVVEKAFLKRIPSYKLCFLASKFLFHATEGEGGGIWSTIKMLPLWGRLRHGSAWILDEWGR